jgi:hypothetical protein
MAVEKWVRSVGDAVSPREMSKGVAVAGSLLVAGIVCMVAAVVGGGVKLLGAEVRVLNSFPRQALLFALGLAFLLASFQVSQTKAPVSTTPASTPASQVANSAATTQQANVTPAAPPSTAPPSTATIVQTGAPVNLPGCHRESALACLPKSSGPVAFADPAAANSAARENIKEGMSTSEGEADATRQGASGKLARLCGIVRSNDSSPLGKHLAALRLNNPHPTDGQANPACMTQAASFL